MLHTSKTIKSINSKKFSFTLVELMIVLAILAILATVIIFALRPSGLFDQWNDQKRVSDISNIQKAIDYLNTWAMGNLVLGTANWVYTSLPDNTSTTCSSWALPTLPTGYSYSCANTTNYRKNDATGWVPINFRESDNSNILSTLPVDPNNDINYYYSYNPGGSYELNTFFKTQKYMDNFGANDSGDSMSAYERGPNLLDMPLTFPHNWIKVPGNSTYSTNDFWVMQYEAKYTTNGKSGSDANFDCKTTGQEIYDTWDWGKAGACTSTVPAWNNINVVSSPVGSPIAGVTHTEAKAICVSLGGHLITNPEWMTIARNVAVQNVNWTSNPQVAGTGYLFNGNSADTVRGYDGPNPDKGNGRNPRAILTLSNSSKIYDFSGNVWEHTMLNISDTLLQNHPTDGGAAGWRWVELTALTGYGDMSYDLTRPINDTWNANYGMGRIYTYNGVFADRVLLRGGIWDNGSYDGAFALFTDWNTGGQYYSVGFRCVR